MRNLLFFTCLIMSIPTLSSCVQASFASKTIPLTVETTRLVDTPVPVTKAEVTEVEGDIAAQETTIPQNTPPAASYTHNYSGTYLQRNNEDFNKYGGCVLKVVHQQITGEPFDNLDFELYCTRGAPSYNMGYASDTILFESYVENMGVWASPYGDCHLVFEFSNTKVIVSQIGYAGECGFGGGIYANGEYYLEDSTFPEIGCMNPNSASNPCITDN